MYRRFSFLMIGLFVVGICYVLSAQTRWQPTGQRYSFQFQEQERSYRIFVPDQLGEKPALVMFLHGGGGNADRSSRYGLTPLAEQEKFVVVYPEGLNRSWNDGRTSEMIADRLSVDDVGFLVEVLERVRETIEFDQDKVFIMGASNGGFMTQRMAIEKPELFAAAGVIIATMPSPLAESFSPEAPMSMIFMNGTQDPLVPYDGGDLKLNFGRTRGKSRGKCTSTDQAVEMWVKHNGMQLANGQKKQLPDTNKEDQCTVETTTWENGDRGTAVQLCRIIGGGHTLPGAFRNRSMDRVFGATNHDISGFQHIWQFFEANAREPAK